MTDRNSQIEAFLKNSGLKRSERIKIPGDASFRRYERIISDKGKYILMDAPVENEDVLPFIEVDEILRDLGLSAPDIIAKDEKNGLLLLEDLGTDKFNHIFKEQPEREDELYKLAVDVLAYIYKSRKRFADHDILPYSRSKLLAEAMLFVDWYLGLFHRIDGDKKDKIAKEYFDIVDRTLGRLKLPDDVMVLRDYHADNLMLMPERQGIKKVGLLDFQDAVMGNAAYDMVSLLEDARRDVPKNMQSEMIEYFLRQSGIDNRQWFLNDYCILGAQRNLKIIGIFSRLKVRDGKEVYLPLIPRVKEYLKQDLEHESLKELREFLSKVMR